MTNYIVLLLTMFCVLNCYACHAEIITQQHTRDYLDNARPHSKIDTPLTYSSMTKVQLAGNTTTVVAKTVAASDGVDKSFLSRQPPPGFVYLTFGIAIITLLTNLIGFVVKRFDRLVDRIYVMKQEYWIKTFLVPVCLEPLREFVIEYSTEVKNIYNNYNNQLFSMRKIQYVQFEDKFKHDKEKLISQFLIINSFNSDVYTKITQKLDEIEDVVTKHCFANTFEIDADHEFFPFKYPDTVLSNMFNKLSEILNIISENHENLYIDRNAIKKLLIRQLRPQS